jgi:hypothetical protein
MFDDRTDLERFSNDWGSLSDDRRAVWGELYLSEGSASFSGGLNPAIPAPPFETRALNGLGNFWFFHHDHAGAHRPWEFHSMCECTG